MGECRTSVEGTPGGHIEPSIHCTKAALGVLGWIPRIVLERGSSMHVEGVPRKTRQEIEPRLQDRNEIAGGRTGCREDIAVEGFIELGLREPKEVVEMQPDRIKLRA